MELDPEDSPQNARAGPNRTPKRKLDQIHGAREAKRANSDTKTPADDSFRKGVFAGLCQADKDHKRTAIQIAADANELFGATGHEKLEDRTAQRWRKDFESDPGSFTAGPKVCVQGHVKFSDSEIKRMRTKFLEHHAFGARKVQRALANEGIAVSTTYLRDLRKSNEPPIKPRRLKHKPKMTQAQQDYRVVFCQLHAGDPWRSWIFSDEFTIEVSLGKCLIWNSTSAADVPVIPTTKDVARFHVFAAVTYDGTLTLQFYDAAMNSRSFTQLLDSGVFPEIQRVREGEQCVLQHDNHPIWTSRETQDFLRDNALVASGLIKTLKPDEWPAYSPDLNLIENMMAHVKTEVEVRFLEEGILEPTIEQWKQYLQEEWARVPAWKIHHYYNSMPQRCADVIARDGRPLDN
jgi:hypothetical protein